MPNIKSPQQQNGSDCGIYALLCAKYVAERFSELGDLTAALEGLNEWLSPERAERYRHDLVATISDVVKNSGKA
jgi:Ulp1 family protease